MMCSGKISRREFLILFSGISLYPAVRNVYFSFDYPQRLIRPPGAVKEEKFLVLCIRCQSCVKVCPTKTLQPAIWYAGLFGLYTPRLVPKIAGCEMTMLCAEVCPTGALKKIKKEEMKIGTAYLNKKICLNWKKGILCLLCVEVCPTFAVHTDKKGRPIVDEKKCSGCAICEHVCPTNPPSIIVYNKGEKRY